MSQKPFFLLGLGAQKAGSTWLQALLAEDPCADFGPLKEYHIWDTIDLPEQAHYDMRHRGVLRNKGEAGLRRLFGKPPGPKVIRAAFQVNPDAYFDFFTHRLAQPNISLTGDITPAYAGLSATRLAYIRDAFLAREIPVKAIFIMRDPVDRLISAAQMSRRKGKTVEGVPLTGSLDDAVLSYASSPEAHIRSDYPATIRAMRSTFDEDSLYFGLFESMRSPQEQARLAEFTGIAMPNPEQAERRVNMHAKTETVSDETRATLRALMAETYAFCAEHVPTTRTLWSEGSTA